MTSHRQIVIEEKDLVPDLDLFQKEKSPLRMPTKKLTFDLSNIRTSLKNNTKVVVEDENYDYK